MLIVAYKVIIVDFRQESQLHLVSLVYGDAIGWSNWTEKDIQSCKTKLLNAVNAG